MTDPPSTPLPARLRELLDKHPHTLTPAEKFEQIGLSYTLCDDLEAAHAETTRLTEELAKARHEEGCERWLRLEAEAETTRLRQERDEWKALNVACKELNATPEKWTMSFDGDAAQHFAKTVAQAFYALNGKNYVEVQLNNANGERFALTFQKVGMFTPDQLKRNAEMRAELAEQRAAAAEAYAASIGAQRDQMTQQLEHRTLVLGAEIKKREAAEARVQALEQQLQEVRANYHDLLYQVKTKHPHESRHETARRYILERERQPSAAASQAKTGELYT